MFLKRNAALKIIDTSFPFSGATCLATNGEYYE